MYRCPAARRRGCVAPRPIAASSLPLASSPLVDLPGRLLHRVEARSDQVDHRREAVPVESIGDIAVQPVQESVRVLLHPPEQVGGGLAGIPVRPLTRLYPAADQRGDEHAEAAAGVIHLVSLLVAASQERLVQRDRPLRRDLDESCHPRLDLVKAAYEGEAGAVVHVPAGIERRFNLELKSVVHRRGSLPRRRGRRIAPPYAAPRPSSRVNSLTEPLQRPDHA